MATIRQAYFNARMGPLLLLSLGSGLAYTLCTDTLQAWLTDLKISLKVLGVAGVIALPFSLKFLWAPLMDRYVPPLLGRRRGWLILTQFAIIAVVIAMANVGDSSLVEQAAAQAGDAASGKPASLWLLGGLSLLLAIVAASQDIVGDAYRTDLLEEHERGAGAAVWVMGWRGGYALSGIAAFVLVGRGLMSWSTAYQIMAGLMLIPVIGTFIAREPRSFVLPPQSLAQTFAQPLRAFLLRPEGLLVLLFILVFKAPDFVAGQMTIPFLRRGGGYTQEQIGWVRQAFGIAVMVVGTFAGGAMCARLSLRACLWACALLQGVSNLVFIPLAYAEASVPMLAGAISVENFIAGMSNAVFIAFLTGHCEARFSATQYALLSGVMALSRTLCALPSGWLAEQAGWTMFFIISAATMLPGLVMVAWVPLSRPPSARGFPVVTDTSPATADRSA